MRAAFRLTVKRSTIDLTINKLKPIRLVAQTRSVPVFLSAGDGVLIVTEDGSAIQVDSYYSPVRITVRKPKAVSITIRS